LAGYTVWNMALSYQVNKQASVYLTGKNLADSDHIVDRTRGIQVGMPRLIQAGVSYGF
jgi:Fe(3+) dicitrate transport protein